MGNSYSLLILIFLVGTGLSIKSYFESNSNMNHDMPPCYNEIINDQFLTNEEKYEKIFWCGYNNKTIKQ